MEERGRQEEIKESNKEVKGIVKDNNESNILTKKAVKCTNNTEK